MFEITMLRKISQTQKQIWQIFSHLWNLDVLNDMKVKGGLFEKQKVPTRGQGKKGRVMEG
jgi:hypothetical protein